MANNSDIEKLNSLENVINPDEMVDLVKNGFIIYRKNGIIKKQRTPAFGKITLHYQNGELSLLDFNEQKK